MEDTLQNIIDQVCQEGIEKSEEEADKTIRKANEKVEAIIERATQLQEQVKEGRVEETQQIQTIKSNHKKENMTL